MRTATRGASAPDLHRRGVLALNAGRLVTARTLLERARERTTDPSLLARIDASLAYASADSAEPTRALELCRRAIAELPDDATSMRGVLWCQEALVLRRLGRASEALRSFDGAVQALADLPYERATALLNRGTVFLDTGALPDAARDFETSAALYDGEADPESGAKARHNLGYTLYLQGDLIGALAHLEAARLVLASASAVVRIVGDQDRAEVLLAAGQVTEGQALMARAAAGYGARRLRQRQGEVELALASRLVVLDPAEGLRWARVAQRRFVRLGTSAWSARAAALVLVAAAQLGRWDADSLAGGDAIAGELDRQGHAWPATSLRLALVRAYLRAGNDDEARARLATIHSRRHDPLSLRLLDADVRAEEAARAGSAAQALRGLRRGLGELSVWQSSFGSLDLQTNVAAHGVPLAVRGLELAVASGRTPLLLEWSERARMLASRVQPVRAPQDEQLVADLTVLRELVQSDSDTSAREAELRRRVREQAWRRDGSGQVVDPCALPELQAGLGGSTALVAYVVTARRVVAVVVTDTAAYRHDLGTRAELDALLRGLHADLDVAAESLPPGLGQLVRGQLVGRLAGLAGFLVAPLVGRLGDRGVVLTPSGVLAGVPWTLLPGFQGRCLTVAQSATSWLARGATPLRTGSVGFVAGPRVERAESEVSATAAMWPAATCLSGDDATAARVSALASTVDVLHVAAHGRHSAENPLFSGVELVDGAWHGYDVDQLTAVPDVVLLSACEVGRSSVRWGEELIGMTAAWLYAGARAVVASSAAVADEVAHDVLVEVHRRLAAGATPAAALSAAVPAATADRPPAPFVCFG